MWIILFPYLKEVKQFHQIFKCFVQNVMEVNQINRANVYRFQIKA